MFTAVFLGLGAIALAIGALACLYLLSAPPARSRSRLAERLAIGHP